MDAKIKELADQLTETLGAAVHPHEFDELTAVFCEAMTAGRSAYISQWPEPIGRINLGTDEPPSKENPFGRSQFHDFSAISIDVDGICYTMNGVTTTIPAAKTGEIKIRLIARTASEADR